MFSLFQSEPYAMLKKTTDSLEGNDKYEGFIVDLANKIASIVGFNFTIVPTKSHGSMNNNGQWNGMIKELLEEVNIKIYEFGKFMNFHNISIFLKQRADVAMADLTINYQREMYVDFTMPFLDLGKKNFFQ